MEITSGQPDINIGGGYGNCGGMWGGDGGIMFLAFLAMMGGFGGGWGGNRGNWNGPMTGDQAPVSSAQFQNGINMQNLADGNRDINDNVNRTAFNTQQVINDKYQETSRDIAALAVGQANALAAQNECCCAIKQEIAAQTLDFTKQFAQMNLVQEQRFAALNSKLDANTIQQLRDQLAAQSQAMQDMRMDMKLNSMRYGLPCGCTGATL